MAAGKKNVLSTKIGKLIDEIRSTDENFDVDGIVGSIFGVKSKLVDKEPTRPVKLKVGKSTRKSGKKSMGINVHDEEIVIDEEILKLELKRIRLQKDKKCQQKK